MFKVKYSQYDPDRVDMVIDEDHRVSAWSSISIDKDDDNFVVTKSVDGYAHAEKNASNVYMIELTVPSYSPTCAKMQSLIYAGAPFSFSFIDKLSLGDAFTGDGCYVQKQTSIQRSAELAESVYIIACLQGEQAVLGRPIV